MKKPEYKYQARITFGNGDLDTILRWNEVCSQAVDLFGLPGCRYITDISSDWMDWIFKDEQDALLFKLKFSEVAI